MLLVLLETSLAVDLATAVHLLGLPGHTGADQAEQLVRRGISEAALVASQTHAVFSSRHDPGWAVK